MSDMDKNLAEEHKELFAPFFEDGSDLDRFIWDILNFKSDFAPRRMLNTVQRLVTLSDEMDTIRKGRRDLSIFFLVTCIEALYTFLPEHEQRIQKQEMVIKFFENYLNQSDKELIENSISISSVGDDDYFIENISISEFSLLLVSIRNNLAHEGIYWSFHFNDEDYSGQTLNIIKSKLVKDEGSREITYEVGLTYSKFRKACIRAFINFISDNFEKIKVRCGNNQG